jgi:Ca2+-binding EF-hand superfamily protein
MNIGSASFDSQRLASLLSQLSAAQSATPDATSAATTADTSTATPTAPPDNCLTGSTTASLSGQVLATLMQMQGTDSSSPASGQAASDPLQTLFSAMDSDGDGTVSQGEMETYLEKNGATQSQADALYTSLDQGGAGGVSESQMGSALQSAQSTQGATPHHHHHHHGGAGGPGGGSPVDALMQALDTDNDGAVSQDEMTSFVTANGGTAAQATSDFTALDTSGSGAVSSADFATAWQNLQASQGQAMSGAQMASMIDAFANANTLVAASTTNVTV